MPTIRSLVDKLRNWLCPLKLCRGREGRILGKLLREHPNIADELYDNVLFRLAKEMTFAQIHQVPSPALRHCLESNRISIMIDVINHHLDRLAFLCSGFGFTTWRVDREHMLHVFSYLPMVLEELDSIDKNRLDFDTEMARKRLCKYFDWIRAYRKDLFFTNK